jgi:hypothetical protein
MRTKNRMQMVKHLEDNMKTDREKIAAAIDSGKMLCSCCPMVDVPEGEYEGDIEISRVCAECIHGPSEGKTDRLIDAIGIENLKYLIKKS